MKKIIKLMVLGACVAMVAAGCKAKDTEETVSPSTSSNAEEKVTVGDVTLGKYKGIEVSLEPTDVSDEDVKAAIDQVVQNKPTYEDITDRTVQNGDIVNISYKGFKDNIPFEGGTADNDEIIIGSDGFIPGIPEFGDGLIDGAIGSTVSLDLTFPEDYDRSPDLAGQDVVFEVTINSIKTSKPAEYNLEFVKSISEFETLEEFEKNVKDTITETKKNSSEQKKMSDVVTSVLNTSEVAKFDQTIIDQQIVDVKAYYESMAQANGMTLDDYIVRMGATKEDFEVQINATAKDVVAQSMILQAIAQKESIELSQEDIDSAAIKFGYTSADEMITSNGEQKVNQILLEEKVIQFLCNNAIIK